jgi:hypothetical protein
MFSSLGTAARKAVSVRGSRALSSGTAPSFFKGVFPILATPFKADECARHPHTRASRQLAALRAPRSHAVTRAAAAVMVCAQRST